MRSFYWVCLWKQSISRHWLRALDPIWDLIWANPNFEWLSPSNSLVEVFCNSSEVRDWLWECWRFKCSVFDARDALRSIFISFIFWGSIWKFSNSAFASSIFQWDLLLCKQADLMLEFKLSFDEKDGALGLKLDDLRRTLAPIFFNLNSGLWLGLPVPKALDKKGSLNILKCHKTKILYNAICREVHKKI